MKVTDGMVVWTYADGIFILDSGKREIDLLYGSIRNDYILLSMTLQTVQRKTKSDFIEGAKINIWVCRNIKLIYCFKSDIKHSSLQLASLFNSY